MVGKLSFLGALGCAGLVLVGGCASAESDRLRERTPIIDPNSFSAGQFGDSGMPDSGSMGGEGGGAGSGGEGAAGGGGDTGGTGGTGGMDIVTCTPNPGDQVCPEICPEICNGEDDDCDRKIDEETDNTCKLDNSSATCEQGACKVVDCDDGFRDCDSNPDNGCEAPADDPNNCGGCGTVCSQLNGTPLCVDGSCAPGECDPGWVDCDANGLDCETDATSLTNCGGCGLPCENVPHATDSCSMGFCGPGACDVGFGDCNTTAGDGCEESLSSVAHCTGCGVACDFVGSTDDCSTGACLATVCDAPDFANCDGDLSDGCESLSDNATCGSCRSVCDTNLPNVAAANCSDRACNVTCAAGFGDCNGDSSDGCEVQLNDNTHCGACDTACTFTDGIADCSSGSCELAGCIAGRGNCDGDDADGCETDTNEDEANCGGCVPGGGTMCPATGTPFCEGGSCSAIACTAPMADCAGSGIECLTNLSTDTQHCGACNNPCAFTTGSPHATLTGCTASQCTISCNSGYADCDGLYENGCEQILNADNHCTACNTQCSVPNASASCASGSCQLVACNPDFGDCTGAPGCETPLNTTSDCNACNNTCNLPGAVETCSGAVGSRTCQVAGCSEAYLRDCPPYASADGCETDVRADDSNCGACGNDCDTHANVQNSSSCSGSSCSYVCDGGFKACDADPNNGCETALNTNGNCTDCGVQCARTNGTTSCASGSCQLTGCNAGSDNCDGVDSNGCEPLTTLQNCGTCMTACNLPNTAESCASGTCQVTTCESGWGDCDGIDSNGCERDTNMLGPCFPDSNCTKQTYDGRDYFFCTNNRSWTAAQSQCRTQLLGDLVRIDDSGENAFLLGHISTDSWIGANDRGAEDAWRWSDNDAQFWQGEGGGNAVGGLYNNWNGSEPNDSSGEDCANIRGSDGRWNDLDCSDTGDFICEVQADLCPADPAKTSPGQCGCGNLDTDSDGDGTADCNDLCPTDMAKTAPLSCGCNNPETDDDGDGEPNCTDECDNDAGKTVPGVCGCNVADTNLDGDSALDCEDGCPYDSSATSGTCDFDYDAGNIDEAALNFASAPDANLDCNFTITTTDPVDVSGWCGSAPTPVVDNGVVVLPLKSLTVAQSITVRVVGNRPLAFAVQGDASVAGTIDASAVGSTPGAGGDVSCSTGTGAGNRDDTTSDDGGGGGGGGGFGASGSGGGRGQGGATGGAGGATEGNAELVPLRGGCAGGRGGYGGRGTDGGRLGGAGGGAVQISVGGTLTLTASGVITASGGGGSRGSDDEDGGGGGGSGGGVLLEAGALVTASGSWVTANGGGAASGNQTGSVNGSPGTDGFANSGSSAPGGTAGTGAGNGGVGDASAGGPGGGAEGVCTGLLGGCGLFGSGNPGAGGGGGGGGMGRVRHVGAFSCDLQGSTSAVATQSCN